MIIPVPPLPGWSMLQDMCNKSIQYRTGSHSPCSSPPLPGWIQSPHWLSWLRSWRPPYVAVCSPPCHSWCSRPRAGIESAGSSSHCPSPPPRSLCCCPWTREEVEAFSVPKVMAGHCLKQVGNTKKICHPPKFKKVLLYETQMARNYDAVLISHQRIWKYVKIKVVTENIIQFDYNQSDQKCQTTQTKGDPYLFWVYMVQSFYWRHKQSEKSQGWQWKRPPSLYWAEW